MKQLWKRIGREWEKTLCWGFILTVLLSAGLLYARLSERTGKVLPHKKAPPPSSLFNEQAFAFLDGAAALNIRQGNPFLPRQEESRPKRVEPPTQRVKPSRPVRPWIDGIFTGFR